MNNTDNRDVVQTTVVKRQKLDKNVTSKNLTKISNNNDNNEMIKKYGVGAKLLSRMGYKIGHGLGSEGKGISKPIEAIKRPHGKAGLGMLSDLSNHQNDDLEDDNGYSSSSSSFSSSVVSEASIFFNENMVNGTPIPSHEKAKKNTESSKEKKIIFNKKGTVTLNNVERLKLINRLKDLEINHPNIKIPYTLLDTLKTKTVISKELRIQIVDIVQKLENIEIQLEILTDRIAILNIQHKSLTVSGSILSDIAQYLSIKDPDAFLIQVPEYIEKILQIENDDIMDILMSRFLKHLFNSQKNYADKDQEIVNFDSNDKSVSELWILTDTPFQKYFLPVVDILQYRIDENMYLKKKLNRTQTVIFQNVYPVISKLIESTKLGSVFDFDTMIATLIDYEQLLKYLNCYDYLLENVLMPKIEDIIYDDWELYADTVNVNWLLNILILLPDEKIQDIKEMVKNKFEDYCYHWYYRDPIISRQNLLIIKQILDSDDQFYKIIRTFLLPKFVKVSDKYFDLEYDMVHLSDKNDNDNDNDYDHDNMDGVQDNFDSIYVFKFIRDHQYIFHSRDYEIFILFFFNSINKFIFDWCFYYNHNQLSVQRAKNWFCWFINQVFFGFTEANAPSQLEISQIKKSKEFLFKLINYSQNNDNNSDNRNNHGNEIDGDFVEITPIHDETFNLLDSLEFIYEATDKDTWRIDCDSEEYKVASLPMRKVTVTFKEVVEDYCVEKGYILQKLNNKYTDISFGSTNCVLVPIYQVRNGSRHKNIAIKDDILWVEDDKGDYTPMYLHEFQI